MSFSRSGDGGCQRLKQFYHFRMALLNSPTEWCSALVIRFVGVDVVTFELYFHRSFVPSLCRKTELWLAVRTNIVGVNDVPSG